MPSTSSYSAVADVAAGLLQDDDPTDKGSVGKAALGSAAKGAAAGMAFGPLGAAIGGVVGGAAGFVKGKKAQKEGLETARLNKIAELKQQKEQFLSKRKIDRATRERNLEFNIGQNPQTNGTGGGNATFAPQGFNTMSAVSDPNINTAGSLFSKPVPPPMDEIQKSKQQQITPVT